MSPLLVAAVLILLSIILIKKIKEKKNDNYPPGPIRLPFIGSYLHLLWIDYYKPHMALTKLKEIYNSPVISFGMGGFNVVVVSNYDTCREVFNNPALQGRVPAYPGLVRTYGEKNGLFGDDGDRWLHIRRQALRAMRDLGFGRRSDDYEAIQLEEVQLLVDRISEHKGEAVAVPEVFFHSLFNLINHLLHGFRYPPKDREVLTSLGRTAVRLISGTDSTGRLIAIWPWIRFIFPDTSGCIDLKDTAKIFQDYMTNSYNTHHDKFDDENIRDLLDYFLISRSKFPDWTDEQVLSSCIDLTFPNAAVGVVVTFTLAYLIENPHLMKKCQDQIDDFVGRGRLPNLNDRQNLTMVEMSIREALRIQSLTPLGAPHRATEDTTLGGYFVPKDSMILTNFWAMNTDPEVWKNPHDFMPERFMDNTNIKDITLPFGLGKRVCAGETFARQNLFLVVSAMIQNFKMELATPFDESKFIYGAAIIPNADLAFKFKPRE